MEQVILFIAFCIVCVVNARLFHLLAEVKKENIELLEERDFAERYIQDKIFKKRAALIIGDGSVFIGGRQINKPFEVQLSVRSMNESPN